jgi:hypothetical protein
MSKLHFFALTIVTLIAAACTMRKSDMWLESGSSLDDVQFGIATERGGTQPIKHLFYIAVRTCYVADQEHRTLWESRGDTNDVPIRIVYGMPPRGFVNEVSPEPLSSGCYQALISGNGISASVDFIVAKDGSVTERVRRPSK